VLSSPRLAARRQQRRIAAAERRLRVLEEAIARYHEQRGVCPPAVGIGQNAGIENLLASLRSTEFGGPFIDESVIADWLSDSDDDGLAELTDPWGNGWIYFDALSYSAEPVVYRSRGQLIDVTANAVGDAFRNPETYQLWCAGPNQVSESGEGDDVGNVPH